MLWPKNSFGDVTWPCALAVAAANTQRQQTAAACQERNLRIDIQNLRKVGRASCVCCRDKITLWEYAPEGDALRSITRRAASTLALTVGVRSSRLDAVSDTLDAAWSAPAQSSRASARVARAP